jgi:hypothetical protein
VVWGAGFCGDISSVPVIFIGLADLFPDFYLNAKYVTSFDGSETNYILLSSDAGDPSSKPWGEVFFLDGIVGSPGFRSSFWKYIYPKADSRITLELYK